MCKMFPAVWRKEDTKYSLGNQIFWDKKYWKHFLTSNTVIALYMHIIDVSDTHTHTRACVFVCGMRKLVLVR